MGKIFLGKHVVESEAIKMNDKRPIIDVRVYRTFEELSHIQEEWDTFIESLEAEIFLTYDWCRVWWKFYKKNRKLFIFIFKFKGVICGILPLFFDKIWLGPSYVNVVKVVGTDFTPITTIVPLRKDLIAEIIQNFMGELTSRIKWDIIHIGPICGKYDSIDKILESLTEVNNGKYHIYNSSKDVQTYFEVAETWEEQLAKLSRKQRQEIKRKYDKPIQNGALIESVLASTDNFQEFFDNFVKMHQKHWENLHKPGHFIAWPSSYEFHREVASAQLEKSRLRLSKIMVDGDCIGYNYSYKFGNTYYRFLYSRAPSKKIDFAKIDFAEMINRGIKENIKRLDSMRGEYNHKLLLGGKLFPIKNIYLYSIQFTSLIRIRSFCFFSLLLNIFYFKIWRNRIAPRIGIRPGPIWEYWIRSNTILW